MSEVHALVAFLEARFTDEAATATAAIDHQGGRWEADPDEAAVYAVSDNAGFTAATDPHRCPEHPEGVPNECDHLRIADTEGVEDALSPVQGARAVHVARQDPQSTLDRVAALRAIVAMAGPGTYDGAGRWTASPLLRRLALAYRRHPEYRPEWSPHGVTADA